MRNVWLILISILVLTGCADFERKQFRKKYDEIVKKEINSGVVIDSIFLDFKFGMSPKEVEAHLKKLTKEGKLELNNKNKYEYRFSLPHEFGKQPFAVLSADYFNDSLYQLRLWCENDPGHTKTQYSLELLQSDLTLLVMGKYFGAHITEKDQIRKGKEIEHFIKGNLHIQIKENFYDQVIIDYIDMNMEKRKDNQELNEKQDAYKNNRNDM